MKLATDPRTPKYAVPRLTKEERTDTPVAVAGKVNEALSATTIVVTVVLAVVETV